VACQALATVLVLASSRGAKADETSDLCLADSIEGQVLKTHGRLTRAREHLERCAEPACEAHMRARCAQWRDEVSAATPVLKIHPVDDLGNAIPDATVRLDGAIIDPSQPVPLDIGPHELRAEHAGRHVVLSLLEPKPGPQDVNVAIDLRSTVPTRPPPTTFWVLGGAATAGVVAFAAFGIATLAQANHLSSCTSFCDPSAKTPLEATETGADVGLTIAVAAGLAATVVYLVRPTVLKDVRFTSRSLTWTF
jgi:hypothetical protein